MILNKIQESSQTLQTSQSRTQSHSSPDRQFTHPDVTLVSTVTDVPHPLPSFDAQLTSNDAVLLPDSKGTQPRSILPNVNQASAVDPIQTLIDVDPWQLLADETQQPVIDDTHPSSPPHHDTYNQERKQLQAITTDIKTIMSKLEIIDTEIELLNTEVKSAYSIIQLLQPHISVLEQDNKSRRQDAATHTTTSFKCLLLGDTNTRRVFRSDLDDNYTRNDDRPQPQSTVATILPSTAPTHRPPLLPTPTHVTSAPARTQPHFSAAAAKSSPPYNVEVGWGKRWMEESGGRCSGTPPELPEIELDSHSMESTSTQLHVLHTTHYTQPHTPLTTHYAQPHITHHTHHKPHNTRPHTHSNIYYTQPNTPQHTPYTHPRALQNTHHTQPRAPPTTHYTEPHTPFPHSLYAVLCTSQHSLQPVPHFAQPHASHNTHYTEPRSPHITHNVQPHTTHATHSPPHLTTHTTHSPTNCPTRIIQKTYQHVGTVGLVALNRRLGCLAPNLTEESGPMKLINLVNSIFSLLNSVEIENQLWKIFPTKPFRELKKKHQEFL
ncbi:hypothetical protein Pcinc_007897, partial [Petrolisthes cinctipes]